MQFSIAIKSILAAGILASTQAMALPISEYSLIIEEDYDHHSAVWGRTFIGGDMVTGGGEFGTRLDRDTALPSLTVVGDISGSQFNVMAGTVEYGGTLTAPVTFNGNVTGANQVNQATLEAQGASMFSELKGASSNYANRTANGDFARSHNNATFSYSGSSEVAFFDVNARDVFTQNTNLSLNLGSATTAIINISTEDLANQGQTFAFDFLAPNGINFGNGFSEQTASNILWNFYDATTLDLQDLKMRGSVLAMGANILSIGTIDGSIAAKSFIQDSQVHNYTFTPPSEVPLPASIQFMLMGLTGLFVAKWYRRRKTA